MGRKTDDMARGRHGNGTFDRTTRTWKLRTAALKTKASIRDLRRLFGDDVPNDERGSYRFWMMFLESVRKVTAICPAHLDQLAAINAFLDNPAEGIYAPLDARTAEFKSIAVKAVADAMAIPKNESLKNEIEIAHEMAKKSDKSGHSATRRYMDLFFSCTGNIRLTEITVHHFRKFVEKVDATEAWGKRTKYNAVAAVKNLLKRIEANHGIPLTFLRSPDFRRDQPDGKKVQWTEQQVRIALANATGVAKAVLLLSLNGGFYVGDLEELSQEHFDGTWINKARQKIKDEDRMVGSWKLWPETKEVLAFNMNKSVMSREFKKLRDEFNLPAPKALRKTVAQWIQERLTEEHARLYRCEKSEGNHGKFYISFTPAQKAKVDAALDMIHDFLFGNTI